MSSPDTSLPNAAPLDEDLAEQANSGHGIPSQDPDPAAQIAIEPREAEREANSALTGGGLVAGIALGAVAGALGGGAASAMVSDDNLIIASKDPLDGVRLHIDDSGGSGSGRPVVLIHGWPLSAQAWELQASVLCAAGYRVVAYDRRGFGRSDKPNSDYSYDTLADDLQRVLDQCGLQDVTLVGFSMGGGEVARYISRSGESRLRSVVFASAVTPYLMNTLDNPEGPLTLRNAKLARKELEDNRCVFVEHFTKDFFMVNGEQLVTESQRAEVISLCNQSAQHAAVACMDSFSTTDFREDLKRVKAPTLVIHGDVDAIVPIEGSGQRTHNAVRHSQMVRVPGGPHGLNLTHARVLNDALLGFLKT
jgi:non-heme chloroperoxidase